MRGMLLVLGVLCVGACANEPVVATKAPLLEFKVRLHFGTQQQTLDRCNALHVWGETVYEAPRGHVLGCNVFNETTSTQDIYTVEPTRRDDAATLTLGHELLHAVLGQYHD